MWLGKRIAQGANNSEYWFLKFNCQKTSKNTANHSQVMHFTVEKIYFLGNKKIEMKFNIVYCEGKMNSFYP